MQRLTFNGFNDLYLTPYGAHTLEDYAELKKQREKAKPQKPAKEIQISNELSIRNERRIDEYGCGLF